MLLLEIGIWAMFGFFACKKIPRSCALQELFASLLGLDIGYTYCIFFFFSALVARLLGGVLLAVVLAVCLLLQAKLAQLLHHEGGR